MMAANHSPLGERVMRLLGWNGTAGRIRVAGLAGSFVCLVGAPLAANAFLGVAHAAWGSAPPGRQEKGSSSLIVVTPEAGPPNEPAPAAAKPVPPVQPRPKPAP